MHNETRTVVWAIDQEEANLLIRASQIKDRILTETEGFAEAAADFLSEIDQLRPEGDGSWPTEALLCAARFASKWRIPYLPSNDQDPSYLAERPFSESPVIDGTLFGVTVIRDSQPPRLLFEIDIRLTAEAIGQRLKPFLTRAREEYQAQGGVTFANLSSKLDRCERALKLEKLKRQGLTDRAIGKLNGWNRSELSKVKKDLQEIHSAGPDGLLSIGSFSHSSPGGMGTETEDHLGPRDPLLTPETYAWLENNAGEILRILRITPPEKRP
jgi:hypothetical protein